MFQQFGGQHVTYAKHKAKCENKPHWPWHLFPHAPKYVHIGYIIKVLEIYNLTTGLPPLNKDELSGTSELLLLLVGPSIKDFPPDCLLKSNRWMDGN